MSKMIPERGRLPGLDGLRAIAVGLVMLYHAGVKHAPGGEGVMLFFVLSGFLITWLLQDEYARSQRISISGFYRRRFLRIFPAYYVYLIAWCALLIVTSRDVPWAHLASAAAYVSNYYTAFNGDPNNALSHTWSLAIEEQFYLLWPAVLVFLRHRSWSVGRFLAIAIGAIWINRFVLTVFVGVDQGYVYGAFDCRADALLVGCLLAVLVKSARTAALFALLTRHWWACLPTLAAFALVTFYRPPAEWCDATTYRNVVVFTLLPPLMAILVLQVVAHCAHPALRWLDSAVMRFLGKLSYSMYLYQQIVVWTVVDRLSGYSQPPAIVAAFLATIVVAAGSYYVVEAPFLKLKDRARGH